ncbi:M10 family metallopeptidase [Paracoccaceae bacterium]|nr:M10 family metallopeptidase [Paracoccaceae bacterium]
MLKLLLNEFYEKRLRKKISAEHASLLSGALAACGGGANENSSGFPENYSPPNPSFDPSIIPDSYYHILRSEYREPYWVQSLTMNMHELVVPVMLEEYSRTVAFAFPEEQPGYNQFGITGWDPATEQIKIATREILGKFEQVLDLSFVEGDQVNATNVITIAQSNQATTAGLSYFPNTHYEVGMDVFIANGYASPQFISELITNYDYEVLVHELGHALGLKHPFEADGSNVIVLSTYEDNTRNTVMSYDDNSVTFNGTLRPLDWMALTKLYGVKSSYNAGDDTYSFSSLGGTFIIDGAGLDAISAADTSRDVTVDLRPGAHSHLGSKSSYITSANQLTISHGSDIENVETGSGDDTVIANALENIIITGAGDDTIFAGDGADFIRSGTGSDRIDLSESNQAVDTVSVDASLFDLGFDTIYGFAQGAAGDVLDITGILATSVDLFPLVPVGAAPMANFSGGVLRLVGDALTTSTDLVNALGIGGALSSLSMSDGARSIIVSAASQDTGEDQSVYYAQGSSAGIQISQLALLQGNALDIDQWHASNFGIVA